jgi:hypothetical protein
MGQQLQAAAALGDFASQERARQLASAAQLAGLGESERQRQLLAAGALPSLGMVGADILSRIGAQQQAQAQRELMAPIVAQQQLLAASGGALPLSALFGSTTTLPMSGSSFGTGLGLASTGLGIASALAPEGATGLAALGGPWGLGLSLGAGLLGGLLS